ncbi:protein-tyrosine-phosphatase [Cryptosporidium felis]|nr:protein-tyrosine-phosphatase [Cryptosporidium felis]
MNLTENNLNGEYILYNIYYANSFEIFDEKAQPNILFLSSKYSLGNISLKIIRELIPKYKLCGCALEKCICKFNVRYKRYDPCGIYKWIWCDLVDNEDMAIPFGSIIVLKILVFNSLIHFEKCDSAYKYTVDRLNNYHLISNSSLNSKKERQSSADHYNMDCFRSNTVSVKAMNSISNSNIGDNTLPSKHTQKPSKSEESRNAIYNNEVNDEINKWSRKPDGTYKDIRILLSTLHQVLWKGAQWEPVEISQLMSDIEVVKKLYRKAIILCHPDRHQKEDEYHKNRAHLIFMAINEAHSKCNI